MLVLPVSVMTCIRVMGLKGTMSTVLCICLNTSVFPSTASTQRSSAVSVGSPLVSRSITATSSPASCTQRYSEKKLSVSKISVRSKAKRIKLNVHRFIFLQFSFWLDLSPHFGCYSRWLDPRPQCKPVKFQVYIVTGGFSLLLPPHSSLPRMPDLLLDVLI